MVNEEVSNLDIKLHKIEENILKDISDQHNNFEEKKKLRINRQNTQKKCILIL